MHRLQVGLFGLAGMLLLVGLANIIMDRARVNDDAAAVAVAENPSVTERQAKSAVPSPASDPLADIGVVPDLPAATEAGGTPPSTTNPPPPAGQ